MDKISDEHLLESCLQEYCQSGIYPMHMPGHKRELAPAPGLPYEWDVTEVPGTDDLHAADGILKEAMDRTSRLFGSRRTWYLVNGSTCGLLAAIYACVPAGGEVILARNCHKSVYHAAELLNLKVHWLLPPFLPEWEIFGSVRPVDVERALGENPSAGTVVITSPTYEGVLSDIASIARICHAHGARLIVDEAHGAHLGLFRSGTGGPAPEPPVGNSFTEPAQGPAPEPADFFPDSALHLGADIVVQSAHKTLPSLTQTALLHLGRGERYAAGAAGEREEGAAHYETEGNAGEETDAALERRMEHALDIFETSSPSYLLMVSLDGCTGLLTNRGEELFASWRREIRRTDEVIAGLQHLKVLRHGTNDREDVIYSYDDSRFLLRPKENGAATGEELADILRREGHVEPEMHCGGNVLLMSSCADTPEGWKIVREALRRADQLTAGCPGGRKLRARDPEKIDTPVIETVLTPAEAHRRVLAGAYRKLPPSQAAGEISAEYVMAYPPGIPLLIPGERITPQALRLIDDLTLTGSGMRYSLSGRGGMAILDNRKGNA